MRKGDKRSDELRDFTCDPFPLYKHLWEATSASWGVVAKRCRQWEYWDGSGGRAGHPVESKLRRVHPAKLINDGNARQVCLRRSSLCNRQLSPEIRRSR